MAVVGRSYDLDWLLELLFLDFSNSWFLDFSYLIEINRLIEVAAR